MRPEKISKTAIDKILRESSCDPRQPGPMKIVADMADPKYLRQRAIEMLVESEYNSPDEKIKMAITLLAMSRFYNRVQGVKETLGPVTRFKNPQTRD